MSPNTVKEELCLGITATYFKITELHKLIDGDHTILANLLGMDRNNRNVLLTALSIQLVALCDRLKMQVEHLRTMLEDGR